jgi:sulfite exporter TauE/SafE
MAADDNAAMSVLRVAATLPDSIGPYVALMAVGFAVAILGHASRSRWLVAVGIIMIFLATLLFPLALQIFSDEPAPPGPTVPQAVVAR